MPFLMRLTAAVYGTDTRVSRAKIERLAAQAPVATRSTHGARIDR